MAVNRIAPAAAAGGLGSNEYSADFITEPDVDLRVAGDGTHSINGVLWTVYLMARANGFDLDAAGLTMDQKGTRRWESTADRGPSIRVPIQTAVSQYTDRRQTVDIQIRLPAQTPGGDENAIIFGVEDDDDLIAEPGGDGYIIKYGDIPDNAAVAAQENRYIAGYRGEQSTEQVPGADVRVMGLRIHGGSMCECYTSIDVADYQTAFTGGAWAQVRNNPGFAGLTEWPGNQFGMSASKMCLLIGKAGNSTTSLSVDACWIKVWDMVTT